jgi:hypothetical protein
MSCSNMDITVDEASLLVTKVDSVDGGGTG